MNNVIPQIFVIAGPNGSGKTTSAKKLLPHILDCCEYVNADAIAAGLSPFNTDAVAIQAGRLMLERIKHLADQKQTFAFETTLASITFTKFLNVCKKNGYQVNILFFWLNSPELAINRVKSRVEQGGHDIPTETIIRRYSRSITNFVSVYMQIADNWFFYDNCSNYPKLIANKFGNNAPSVKNNEPWNNIMEGVLNETINK